MGNSELRIVASQDIGPLGAKDGSPVTFPWRWYYSVPTLPLWALIVLLLVVPKANRHRQAWLILIPLGVVLFCVALGALFMWLTSERKGMDDYLQSLRASSGMRRSQQAEYLLNYIQESKRWQGIFDVTAQMSADRDEDRVGGVVLSPAGKFRR